MTYILHKTFLHGWTSKKMLQKAYFLTLLLFLTTIAACSSPKAAGDSRDDYIELLHQSACLATFEAFARGDVDRYPKSDIEPSAPWTVQATGPIPDNAAGTVYFIRYPNNEAKHDNSEMWISTGREREFYVYLLDLDRWEMVSRKVVGTDRIVNELFLADDGTVWGRSYWTSDHENTLLSRFNEETRRFEPVYRYHQSGLLELGPNNVFWLLTHGDGLYTFDTKSNIFTRGIDSPPGLVTEMIMTDQGDIYFLMDDGSLTGTRQDPDPQLNQGALFRFSSKTSLFEEFPLPEEPWPQRRGTLYVVDNQLWIDAIGYFDLTSETWHLLYSDLLVYVSNDLFWISPELLLKDSYDIYWFALYGDNAIGMAWYDPVSGEGCMFTTRLSSIVEDLDRNLWMYSAGNLYVWRRDSS